jgi:superfamily I DNA/RNA helicase
MAINPMWSNKTHIKLITFRSMNRRSARYAVIEWFAEWARETWGEQTGLKLLTAHRAKGLEFDDVIILDGGWERPSRNEDQDAPRRLFYVAMTRARRNLIVMGSIRNAVYEGQPMQF